MGDLPDAKPVKDKDDVPSKPMMSKIYDTLGKRYKKKKQMEEKCNNKVLSKLFLQIKINPLILSIKSF